MQNPVFQVKNLKVQSHCGWERYQPKSKRLQGSFIGMGTQLLPLFPTRSEEKVENRVTLLFRGTLFVTFVIRYTIQGRHITLFRVDTLHYSGRHITLFSVDTSHYSGRHITLFRQTHHTTQVRYITVFRQAHHTIQGRYNTLFQQTYQTIQGRHITLFRVDTLHYSGRHITI